MGFSIKTYLIFGSVIAALILIFYFRHDIIKSEDAKVTATSEAVVLDVEDKKNEIRSVPVSTARTAGRLHAGTYFNH